MPFLAEILTDTEIKQSMQQNTNEIEINGVKYVPKDTATMRTVAMPTENVVVVRTEKAGVFYGTLTSSKAELENGIVELSNARRIWYWSGAASLSQLAVDGVSKPDECKFPTSVPSIKLTGVIEIIPCTSKALLSLNSVKVWAV